MKKEKGRPVIYKYDSYRAYLKDLFTFHQHKNPHFTHRFFSNKAGFASPSILKEVTDGKKNLTDKSAGQFALGFNLDKSETGYFLSLVRFNQSTTEQDKNSHYQELQKWRKLRDSRTLTSRQYDYYSQWYNSAIRELIATRDFKNDPEWIAGRLTPAITPAEAAKTVELLIALGLVKKNEDQTLTQDSPKLEVDPDVSTLSIRNYNRKMADLGKEAIERHSQNKREVSGLTLSVSREAAMEIRAMVREFKKKILDHAVADTRPAEEVYQLNFQLFPLTREAESAS